MHNTLIVRCDHISFQFESFVQTDRSKTDTGIVETMLIVQLFGKFYERSLLRDLHLKFLYLYLGRAKLVNRFCHSGNERVFYKAKCRRPKSNW